MRWVDSPDQSSPAIPRRKRWATASPGIIAVIVALLIWEAAVRLLAVPAYLLPAPSRVFATLIERFGVIAPEAAVTTLEILGGFAAGTAAGMAFALVMAR